MKRDDEIKNTIRLATERLTEGLESLKQSDTYKAYLRMQATLHQYSYRNCCLIFNQKPDATFVASYTTWKSLNRYVRRGEKGIQILAPCFKREMVQTEKYDLSGNPVKEEKEVIKRSYKVETVFDISQTEGEELQILHNLTGELMNLNDYVRALQTATSARINYGQIAGCNGFYRPTTNEIVVSEALDDRQKLKTCIHETAHSLLHNPVDGIDKNASEQIMELEAESVAFVVMEHFGLPSDDYSFGYIAGWSKGSTEKLKEILPHIQTAAHKIITCMEKEFEIIEEEKLEEIRTTEIVADAETITLKDYLKSEAEKAGYGSYAEFYEAGLRVENYEHITPQLLDKAFDIEYITFYVSESEIQALGKYIETDSLKEAVRQYQDILEKQSGMTPELGFIYHNPKDLVMDEAKMPILTGNTIRDDIINGVAVFRNNRDVIRAIEQVKAEKPKLVKTAGLHMVM